MGELLTIWSVRLAVGCYLGRYLVERWCRSESRNPRTVRMLWTAGCGLYVAHVICAFAFVHEWSHTNAYAHTAEQTEAVTGWNWGGGLYFNYLFTVVWVADVVRMWRIGGAFAKRAWRIGVELFLAFMVVNATVVFGPPLWKWIGVGLAAAWGCLLLLRSKAVDSTEPKQ